MNHFLNFKKLFPVDALTFREEIKSPELERNTEIVVSYYEEVLDIVSFRVFCKVIDKYYDVIDSKNSYIIKILNISMLWNTVNTLIAKKLFEKISTKGLDEGELFIYFLYRGKIFSE